MKRLRQRRDGPPGLSRLFGPEKQHRPRLECPPEVVSTRTYLYRNSAPICRGRLMGRWPAAGPSNRLTGRPLTDAEGKLHTGNVPDLNCVLATVKKRPYSPLLKKKRRSTACRFWATSKEQVMGRCLAACRFMPV